ncbi:hypothetical protein BHE90_002625 [Fusarium euwallaceae]|uniref:Uncharacterized protein n=1 Tax=Fusarium euwallaceae TaxID=1147111 RepID=A0A430M4E1_9HYPO|nr:hypothetical protein BHE90_002625 [Fusarium euwallaceae]
MCNVVNLVLFGSIDVPASLSPAPIQAFASSWKLQNNKKKHRKPVSILLWYSLILPLDSDSRPFEQGQGRPKFARVRQENAAAKAASPSSTVAPLSHTSVSASTTEPEPTTAGAQNIVTPTSNTKYPDPPVSDTQNSPSFWSTQNSNSLTGTLNTERTPSSHQKASSLTGSFKSSDTEMGQLFSLGY